MANIEVYLTSLGCSARENFCDRLTPLGGRGALVLPNALLVQRTRANRPRFNADVLSMDALASRILNLNGYRDFRKLTSHEQELVVAELLQDLPKEYSLSYFNRLVEKPGFVKSMTSLFRQLSNTGMSQEDICNVFRNYEGNLLSKHKDIVLLYEFYRNYIKGKNWFDLEGKLRLAIHVMQKDNAKLPWDEVAFSDFYDYTPLELELIKELSQHIRVRLGLCYEKNLQDSARGRYRYFEATAKTYERLEGMLGAKQEFAIEIKPYKSQKKAELSVGCRQLREQLGRDAVTTISAQSDVQLYSFDAREQEMRYAMTRIKQLLLDGTPAEDILLSVRSLEQYGGLHSIAEEYGVPLNLPLKTKLAVQPLTQALLLVQQAVEDTRLGAEAYVKLLSLSFMQPFVGNSVAQKLSSMQKKSYFAKRSDLQKELKQAASSEKLTLLDEYIDKLGVPQPGSVKGYCGLLQQLLQELEIENTLGEAHQRGELELAPLSTSLKTLASLREALQAIERDYHNCGQDEKPLDFNEWQQLLTDSLQGVDVLLAKGRTNGVLVRGADSVQGMEFPYVFLMGLREGEFPSVNNENWIYNDKERAALRALGLELPDTASLYAADACFFASVVASATKQLVVSWVKDEEAGASVYVDAIKSLFQDEVVHNPQKGIASKEERLLREQCFPDSFVKNNWGEELWEAAQVDERRKSEQCYNGKLAQELVNLSKLSPFSATSLELYAQCPFSYLGQRVWHLSEQKEKEENLTPADEGELLHSVLEKFLKRHLHENITSHPLTDLQKELDDVFDQAVREKEAENRLIKGSFWQWQEQSMRSMLQRWLKVEYDYNYRPDTTASPDQLDVDDLFASAKQSDAAPVAQADAYIAIPKNDSYTPPAYNPEVMEWKFGFSEQSDAKPYILTLADGTEIELKGSVDRIDASTEDNEAFITDYKLGKAPNATDISRGFNLQMPLYMLAVAKLYGRGIRGGMYYVLKAAEHKNAILFGDSPNASLKISDYSKAKLTFLTDGGKKTSPLNWHKFERFTTELLKHYIENIREGDFALDSRRRCDAYCPLQDICRKQLVRADSEEMESFLKDLQAACVK